MYVGFKKERERGMGSSGREIEGKSIPHQYSPPNNKS